MVITTNSNKHDYVFECVNFMYSFVTAGQARSPLFPSHSDTAPTSLRT